MALNKPLTPLDKEKNNELIEEDAFKLLHTWLQPNMPKSNKWAFGEYVKLWLRRNGQIIHCYNPIDHTPKPNLYDALIDTFPDSPCPTTIQGGLGVGKRISHTFWQNPERLQQTLTFLNVSALYTLKALNIVPHLTPEPPGSEAELNMLDTFWQKPKNRWHGNETELKAFARWIKKVIMPAKWGYQKELATQLARATGWNINLSQSAHDSLLGKLFKGKGGNWTLPMLKILAKFATEKTGEAYTSKRIATEYLKWRKENPPK